MTDILFYDKLLNYGLKDAHQMAVVINGFDSLNLCSELNFSFRDGQGNIF